MAYNIFKVTVRLHGGTKLNYKITAQNVDEAKAHITQYLEHKGKQIKTIHCSLYK